MPVYAWLMIRRSVYEEATSLRNSRWTLPSGVITTPISALAQFLTEPAQREAQYTLWWVWEDRVSHRTSSKLFILKKYGTIKSRFSFNYQLKVSHTHVVSSGIFLKCSIQACYMCVQHKASWSIVCWICLYSMYERAIVLQSSFYRMRISAFNYHTCHRPIKPKWLEFFDIQVSRAIALHLSACAQCMLVCYEYVHACVYCIAHEPVCLLHLYQLLWHCWGVV